MAVVEVTRGDAAVILAFPHTGTEVPPGIWQRLNANGRILADTDWHIHRLYDGLLPGVTTVRAMFHRYVIDANRDPSGASLYPGQNTTGLIPETDFDGQAIWQRGQEPASSDMAARLAQFHKPYHAALQSEIARVKALHGAVLLYDCHSIRSHIPFLFEGTLPDFSIGTNNGVTCHPALSDAIIAIARDAPGYSQVLNGRFKGGWTTRHYGKPETGIHAIQMELAQSTHLASEAPPFAYDEAKAGRLRQHLGAMLQSLAALLRHLKT